MLVKIAYHNNSQVLLLECSTVRLIPEGDTLVVTSATKDLKLSKVFEFKINDDCTLHLYSDAGEKFDTFRWKEPSR